MKRGFFFFNTKNTINVNPLLMKSKNSNNKLDLKSEVHKLHNEQVNTQSHFGSLKLPLCKISMIWNTNCHMWSKMVPKYKVYAKGKGNQKKKKTSSFLSNLLPLPLPTLKWPWRRLHHLWFGSYFNALLEGLVCSLSLVFIKYFY